MTENSALPRAGWYPDPDVPGQIRWWDGFQWQVSKPVDEVYQPLGRSFTVLGWLLTGLLATIAALFVARIVLSGWASGAVVHAIQDGELAAPETYDRFDRLTVLATTGCLVAAIVIWCVWQHQAASSTDHDELRRSPRMHVLSWFIPVVSLWFPLQNMRDLWDVNVGPRRRFLVGWWWAFWIIANISTRLSDSAHDSIRDARGFSDFLVADAVDSALWLILCGLALHLVVTLTPAVKATEHERRMRLAA
jgi:amino acid transporter